MSPMTDIRTRCLGGKSMAFQRALAALDLLGRSARITAHLPRRDSGGPVSGDTPGALGNSPVDRINSCGFFVPGIKGKE